MRDRTIPSVEQMELVGGRLCLDFVNTVNRGDGREHDDRFESYGAVLRWSARLGLIAGETTESLAAAGARFPDKASSALRCILELRECLWRLFAGEPATRDLKRLQRALRRTTAPPLRKRRDGGIVLVPERDLAGWLLHTVAGSAIELLSSSALARVKVCPGDRCKWIFLDDSPNNRRKWCSMKTCGNRHKAREHYRQRNA